MPLCRALYHDLALANRPAAWGIFPMRSELRRCMPRKASSCTEQIEVWRPMRRRCRGGLPPAWVFPLVRGVWRGAARCRQGTSYTMTAGRLVHDGEGVSYTTAMRLPVG